MQSSPILRLRGRIFKDNAWCDGSLLFFRTPCGMFYVVEIYGDRQGLRLSKKFSPSQLKHLPPRNYTRVYRKCVYFTLEDGTHIKIISNQESISQLTWFLNDIKESSHGNSISRMRNSGGNSPYARTYGQHQFAATRRNGYVARHGPVIKSPSGHRLSQCSNAFRHPKDPQEMNHDHRSRPSSYSSQNFSHSTRDSRHFGESRTPLKILTSNSNHDHSKRPKQLDLDASKRPKLNGDIFPKEGGQLGGQLVKDLPLQKSLHLLEGTSNDSVAEPGPYTGFPNIGNSCFMNSVLQSLLQLRCISDDLDSTRQVLEKNLPEQSIIRYLLSLLSSPPEELQKLLGQTLEVISNSSPCFADGQQHDALEFLVQLLDVIKEEVKKASCGSSTPDPVTNNIEFQLSSSYMCQKCQKLIYKREVLHMLSLNVPNLRGSEHSGLSDALKDYFEPQEIEMKCEHCSGTSTKCVQGFSTLPRVLVFHLKRYTYLDGTCKIMCPVQVPIHLSLAEFVIDQAISLEQSIKSFPSQSIVTTSIEEDSPLLSTHTSPISSSPESSVEKKVLSNSHSKAMIPLKFNTKAHQCSSPAKKVMGNSLHPPSPNVPIVLKGGSDSASIASPVPAIGSDVPVDKAEVNVMETISEETEEEQFEKVLKLSRESAQCQEDKELIEAMNRSVQDISCNFMEEYEVCQEEPTVPTKDNSDTENLSGPFSYRLASVVSHIGQNADTGHYVANYFDSHSSQWWHFNDEVVHRKSKHSVLESIKTQGYLFFYVAREATD